MLRTFFVIFISLVSITGFAQQDSDIKELYDKVAKSKEDTSKINLLAKLSLLLKTEKRLEEQGHVNKSLLALSTKLNNKLGIANSQILEGNRLMSLEKNDLALKEFLKAIPYVEKHSPAFAQTTTQKLSRLYYLIGDYPKSLEYGIKSLQWGEKRNDQKFIANQSANLGNIYHQIGDKERALDYYLKALNMAQQLDSKQSIAVNKVQIASIYIDEEKYEKGFGLLLEALEINKELKKGSFLANNYLNLGRCAINLEKLSEAQNYLELAKMEFERISDQEGIASVYTELLKLNVKQGNLLESKEYGLKGLEIAEEKNYMDLRLSLLYRLSEVSEQLSDYKNAYEYYLKYVELNDSVFSLKQQKLFLEKQVSFEYEKKEALAKAEFEKIQALNRMELERKKQAFLLLEKNNAFNELQLNQSTLLLKKKQAETEASNRKLSLLNKEKLLEEAYSREKSRELSRQKIIRNAFIGGAVFMLLMALFIFRSLKKSKSQNKIIEEQKILVEKQKILVEAHNAGILDSITYAKRIQQAILPSFDLIYTAFSDVFVYYQPKDIVAGDFYWMEQMDDLTFFAVADSTGHGVPGALVSVVCSNALNRAVLEFDLTEPGEILDKTRELVLETFSKNGEEIKDGMDISFCSIDTENSLVKWSGANNPLWYIQNDALIEIKPNKQAIGKVDNPQPFTTHLIPINVETQFFLFTDGYADQFGGERGKKMKYKPFAELITASCNEAMETQFERLKTNFNNWKGSLEQVDDVCVVSFKLYPNHK